MAFIINESFTTGSLPAGWYVSSSGNFNYTTAPAPLEGTKSLRITTADAFGAAYFGAGETGEQWGHFMLSMDALPGSGLFHKFYSLYDGSLNELITLTVKDDGTMEIADTSGALGVGATASGISAATTYHLWWRYKPGSGANGELELWVNTSNDRAGTAAGFHASIANRGYTTGADGFNFTGTIGTGTNNFIVDTVQWADTDEFAGAVALPPGRSTGFFD